MFAEVVVALFDRLHVGCSLHLATPVEVEVREDPEQPGAEVRARGVRLPAPERSTVGVLDKILSLLSGSDESARDAIHLVGERESLFLEANAIARLRRDPASIEFGLSVTHRANLAVTHAQTHASIAVFRVSHDSRDSDDLELAEPRLRHCRDESVA